MNKEQYINAIEYYSVIKRSKFLTSLAQKATYGLIFFISYSGKCRFIGIESRWVGHRGKE